MQGVQTAGAQSGGLSDRHNPLTANGCGASSDRAGLVWFLVERQGHVMPSDRGRPLQSRWVHFMQSRARKSRIRSQGRVTAGRDEAAVPADQKNPLRAGSSHQPLEATAISCYATASPEGFMAAVNRQLCRSIEAEPAQAMPAWVMPPIQQRPGRPKDRRLLAACGRIAAMPISHPRRRTCFRAVQLQAQAAKRPTMRAAVAGPVAASSRQPSAWGQGSIGRSLVVTQEAAVRPFDRRSHSSQVGIGSRAGCGPQSQARLAPSLPLGRNRKGCRPSRTPATRPARNQIQPCNWAYRWGGAVHREAIAR